MSEPRPRKELSPRGSSRPPFEPGNTLSVKHGAFSPRAIAERAAEVRLLLEEVVPELAQPLFRDAVERYCEAQARSKMLGDHIARVVESEGVEKVAVYLWDASQKASALAAKLGADCGLDAAGLARISRDLGLASNARRLAHQGGPVLGEEGRSTRIARGRYPQEGVDK